MSTRVARDAAEHLQTMSASILSAIVCGKIDTIQLVHEELAARGLDANGKWVGFDRAAEIHGVQR